MCPQVPRSRTLVSNSVQQEQQAAAMSGFSALQSVANFCVPGAALGYSYTVYNCPNCMYLVFAGVCAVCAVLVLIAIYWINVSSGKRRSLLAMWGWGCGGERDNKEKEGEEPLLLVNDA